MGSPGRIHQAQRSPYRGQDCPQLFLPLKILIITQFYWPEPVPKVALLARSLVERGHSVTVLTGLPCYPEGRIYPQYKGKLFTIERADGVEVIRVPQIPDHSASAIRRILYYLSFPIFAALRLVLMARRSYDLAYFYGSAVPVLALASLVRMFFKIRCVFDVADLWPESVASSGLLRSGWSLRALTSLCGFLYRRADHIGAVTEGYKSRLMAHGIPAENISVTYYCVADLLEPAAPPPQTSNFTVAFTGMIGRPQDLGVLLDAAKLLAKERVIFLIAGSGTEYEALVQRRDAEAIENVTFLGRLPVDQMPGLYAQADVLVVHLKPDCLSVVSIPSKTYSYMAAGKPILMAVDGEAGDFVERHQCGIVAKAGDPLAVAAAIRNLMELAPSVLAQLGQNARVTYESKFSPDAHVTQWEQLLARFALQHTREPSDRAKAVAKAANIPGKCS